MCKIHCKIVRFGKIAADFTVCLKIHHTDFITFRYYIATLHFHIFLLFSYFFLRTETARRKIGGLFQLAKKDLRSRLFFVSARKIIL